MIAFNVPGVAAIFGKIPEARAQVSAACADCNVSRHTVYRVTLRMDDGSQRTLSQPDAPPYAVGERVRIGNGRILERT